MTARFASALYQGQVTHARTRPREHKLSYRVYSLLLDLDELDTLDRTLRLFSVDRWNLFSFHRKDRGDGSGRDLRGQVEASLRAAGIEPDGGPIRLLTMPRLLGWSFNPLSIYFCHRRNGEIAAILWEVDNTFGERHAYMIPVSPNISGEIRQTCAKELFVSPFMGMDMTYTFHVRPPGQLFNLRIDANDSAGLLLCARQTAHRLELSDRSLLRAFFAIPALTLRVVAGIHWQAMKLWWKGVGLQPHPRPPANPVSIAHPAAPSLEVHEP
jgi:uncharacterized protein